MKKKIAGMLCTVIFIAIIICACQDEAVVVSPSTQPSQSIAPTSPVAMPAPTPVSTPATSTPAADSVTPSTRSDYTFLANVYYDATAQGDTEDGLLLFVEELLWIDGDDEATLAQYGISPDEVNNDYAIVSKGGEQQSYVATQETLFWVQYGEDYELDPRAVNLEGFYLYLFHAFDHAILAEVTLSGADENTVLKIEEIYTP